MSIEDLGTDNEATPRLEDAVEGAFDRAQEKIASGDDDSSVDTDDLAGKGGDGDSSEISPPDPEVPAAGGDSDLGSDDPGDEPVAAQLPDGFLDGLDEVDRDIWGKIPEDAAALVASQLGSVISERDAVLTEFEPVRASLMPLVDSIKANNLDSAGLVSLMETNTRFGDDPKDVLQELADQAGVDIAFDVTPEMPEFEDREALLTWQQEQIEKKIARKSGAEQKQRDREAAKQQAEADMTAGLTAAASKYGADFEAVKPGVLSHLQENSLLSAEQAYRLAAFDDVQAIAQKSVALQAELDSARAELEKARKAATQPVSGPAGGATPDDEPTTGVEGAYERAERKRAQLKAG